MHDAHDFSLLITVMPAEPRDELAATTPFARLSAAALSVATRAGADRRRRSATEAPLPAPRQTWLPSAKATAPSAAPALLAACPSTDLRMPPPRAHASPLSDDDALRMQRRARAHRRIAWARALLRRFNFVSRTAALT